MYSGGSCTDPNNNSGAVTFTGSGCAGTDPNCPFDCCRKWNGAIPACADRRAVGLQAGDGSYNAFRYIAAPPPPPELLPPPPSQPRPPRPSARPARPHNQLQPRQPRPRTSAPVAPTPFPFPGPVQRMTPPVQMPPWHHLPAHARPPTPMTPEVYRAFQAGFMVGQSQSSQPQSPSVVQNNDMHAHTSQPAPRTRYPPPPVQGLQGYPHPYPYGYPHPGTPNPPPWANRYGSGGPMYPPQFSSPHARHTRTPGNGSFCECGCPSWPRPANQAQMHTQPPQHWIPRPPSPTSTHCSNRCGRIRPAPPVRAPPYAGQYGQEFGNVGRAHQQRMPMRVFMPVAPTPTPSLFVPPTPPQPPPQNPLQQLSHMTAAHVEDVRNRFQVPGAKRGRRQKEVDGQDQLIRNYCPQPPPSPPPGFEDPTGGEQQHGQQQTAGTSVEMQLQMQNPPRRQRETLAELHDRIRTTNQQLRQQLPRISDGAIRPKPHTPSPPASPPPTPAPLVIDEGSPGNSGSSVQSGTEQPLKRGRGRPRKSVTPVGLAATLPPGQDAAVVAPPGEIVMPDTDTRARVEVLMEELASRMTPNPVPQPVNQSTSLDFRTNTNPSPPPPAPPSIPPTPTQPPTSFLSSSLGSSPTPPKAKRSKLTGRFEINCSICNKLCKSNKSLQKHVKLVHFQPEIRHRGITWFPPRPPPPFVGDLQQLRHATLKNARGPGLTPPPLFVGPAGAAAAQPRPSPSPTPQFPVIRPEFLRWTTPTVTPLQPPGPSPLSSAAVLPQMPPFKNIRIEGYQPQPRPFCRQPSCLTCSPETATASAVPPLPQRSQIRERIPTSRPIRPPETILPQPPVTIESTEPEAVNSPTPTHTPKPLLPIPRSPSCPSYELISPCSSPPSPPAQGPIAPTTELMGMLTETSTAVLEALIVRPRTPDPTLPHSPSPPSPPPPLPRPLPPATPLELRKREPKVMTLSDSEDGESENQSSSDDEQATFPATTTQVPRSPDLRTPSQAGSPAPSSSSSSGGSCSSSSSQSQGPEIPFLPDMSPAANSHHGPPTPDASTQSPAEAEGSDSNSSASSPASSSPSDEREDESDDDGDGRLSPYASSLSSTPPSRTPTPKSPAFVSISRAASGSPEPEMPPTPPSSMSSPARSPESSSSNPESPPESPQSPPDQLRRKSPNAMMAQPPIVVNLVACPFCPFLCMDEGHKLAHCEEMHSENELVFCGFCYNIFLGKAMLKEHEANGCCMQG